MRAGLVEVEITAGEHAEEVRIDLEPAASMRLEHERGAGVLECAVRRAGVQLASARLQAGVRNEVTLPPGGYDVELLLRSDSGTEPSALHREERLVDVVAGEVAGVRFKR